MIDAQAKAARARELFLEGYNCAQAIAGAYASELGMEEKRAVRLASGFGAGIGGMRGVCGALSGMMLVYGFVRGYDEAVDMEGKKRLYASEQAMAKRFTDTFEALHCRELLRRAGIEATSTPSERTPEYYKKRPCVRYIEACARILADALNEA